MFAQTTYLNSPIPEIGIYRAHISGTQGAVTAPNPYATQAALEIMKKGGNAVDAAAAAWLTIAVVECYHAGIGGGCFQIFYHKETNQFYSIDARGVAPLNAYREMFLDEDGNVDTNLTEFSGRSVAVPSGYRGVDMMLKRFGSMSWEDVSEPAIHLARNGFSCGFIYSRMVESPEAHYNAETFEGFKELYWPNGNPPKYGEKIFNPELANTIEQVAQNGIDWFYEGQIADDIVDAANRYYGLLQKKDLNECKAYERPVLHGTYRGHDVYSMYPPSSGGAHIIQMLNILENFNLKAMGHNSADYTHLLAEVLKIMYADRSIAMGDPDFVNIPIQKLISKEYAKELANKVSMRSAQSFKPTPGMSALPKEPMSNTANFCIMDKYGNTIVSTQTVRNFWGSGVVVKNRGFLLNNAMADFSPKLGVKTCHGMAYGEANAIRPGATPLSSMSPTIVVKNGEPFLAVGAVGGPRIISSTLQMILNVIDHGMLMDIAVRAPYLCCLNQEAGLELEYGFSPDTIRELTERGHKIHALPPLAALSTIPNGILKLDGICYPGETGRADGAAGAITESGSIAINGTVYMK